MEALLRELEARAAQQGIRLAHTPAAARLLVREAYEPSSGARSPKTSHSTCAVSAPGATERERATAPLRYHVSLLSRSDK